MVGTWTYTVATNIIAVTGGTAGAPCTFLDAWTADKAGTYNIVATRNIVVADGAPVAVTNALRPADYVMLGIADLYLQLQISYLIAPFKLWALIILAMLLRKTSP